MTGINPFDAISYVTSGLTLLAFLAAVVAWVTRAALKRKSQLIRSAAEADRGSLVEDALSSFRIDTGPLTPGQKFELLMTRMAHREDRWRLILRYALFAFLAGVVAVGIYIRVDGNKNDLLSSVESTNVDAPSWSIERMYFQASETFPEAHFDFSGGSSDKAVEAVTVHVSEVWQSATIWSTTSAPGEWDYDVELPVLGAPYDKNIEILRELIPGETVSITLVLGSDAPPDWVEFIYDVRFVFHLDDGTTMETQDALFFAESPAIWITRRNDGNWEDAMTRNIAVANSIKMLTRVHDLGVRNFLETFSDAGIHTFVEMLDDPLAERRRTAARLLALFGPRARSALDDLRKSASGDTDYLVRTESARAIEIIQMRDARAQAEPIPDPIKIALQIKSWWNPPDFVRKWVDVEREPLPASYDEFTMDDWHSKGYDELQREQYEAAIASLTKAIEMGHDDRFTRGRSYLSAGRNEEAIDDFTFEIENYDVFHYDWTYHNRGLAYRRLGNVEAAFADVERAIELRPGNGAHYRLRGLLRSGTGDHEMAIVDFQKTVELEPLDSINHLNLAEALIVSGKSDQVGSLAATIESLAPKEQSDLALAYFLEAVAGLNTGADTIDLDRKLISVSDAGAGTWDFSVLRVWLESGVVDETVAQGIRTRLELLSN